LPQSQPFFTKLFFFDPFSFRTVNLILRFNGTAGFASLQYPVLIEEVWKNSVQAYCNPGKIHLQFTLQLINI